MKPRHTYGLTGALAALLFFAAGCSAFTPGEMQPLAIHLQGGFDGDDVSVWVDGDVVFRSTVTTNNLLGLAQEIEIDRREGRHLVTVRINDGATANTSIDLKEPLFIGISYNDAEDRFNFIVSEDGFVYF